MSAAGHAAGIRVLCLDVDGVLTDGTVALDDMGHETKRFNVKDGLGIAVWRRLGGDVAVITGRAGLAVRHRLEELGVRRLHAGVVDKASAIADVARDAGCPLSQVAFVGDDMTSENVSLLSPFVSPFTVTETVFEVSPAANVSVPLVAT